jgi:hypothetical protein
MIAIGCLFLLSFSTQAQDDRWAGEFRPGVNMATQKLNEVSMRPGLGGEFTLAYRFMQHGSIYAGWGWNQFTPDMEDAGHYEETGYTFGLRFQHPITEWLEYVLAIGSIYEHLELEDKEGTIFGDTGHGFGWQAEAGLAIPFNEKWRLTPGLRYRSLSRELTVDEYSTQLDLTYLSLGVGVALTF